MATGPKAESTTLTTGTLQVSCSPPCRYPTPPPVSSSTLLGRFYRLNTFITLPVSAVYTANQNIGRKIHKHPPPPHPLPWTRKLPFTLFSESLAFDIKMTRWLNPIESTCIELITVTPVENGRFCRQWTFYVKYMFVCAE